MLPLAPTAGPTPQSHDDGTVSAVVLQPVFESGGAVLLTLALPPLTLTPPLSGRYWLVRCGAHNEFERQEAWSFTLRQPLMLASADAATDEAAAVDFTRCVVVAPPFAEGGARWLAALPAGSLVNLLGPFGQGFSLNETTRNLLLATDLAHLPLLSSLIDHALDRNLRVTLVMPKPALTADELRSRLPLAVELHLTADDTEWRQALTETMRWADQLMAALPNAAYVDLAQVVRSQRMRAQTGFAQVLVAADLVCGVGACLACTIPLADGSLTRACMHGPVFDLLHLYGDPRR